MQAPQIHRKAFLIHKVEKTAISESVQKWKKSKETAYSLLMSVLGDDIFNDLTNELGDPATMWKSLEDTYRSKTGTNILTIMNGVVTKKLGRNERMSTHIGHLDSLFHQLTNIQDSDEANEKQLVEVPTGKVHGTGCC
jgi:gag-polypeptide of LTR copia-type